MNFSWEPPVEVQYFWNHGHLIIAMAVADANVEIPCSSWLQPQKTEIQFVPWPASKSDLVSVG